MKKRVTAIILTSLMAISTISSSYACTGFVAGKDATAAGDPIIARTEDFSGGVHNKTFVVYPHKENTKETIFTDPTGFKITLPKTQYKYTAICDAEQSEGIYDEVGFNEMGVAMSATVSAGVGDAANKADPLVENGGLSEASITTVVLPYIKTAKEGVQRIADIIDKHGAAEGNIVFFADDKEVWYMEILSGHQYAAVKVPDDVYAVVPNHFLLGSIDIKSPDVIVSKNLISLPKQKGFYKEHKGKFHIALTYGEKFDDYNRPRIWGGQNMFSKSTKVPYDKDVFEIWRKPDKKISIEDVMELQRYRYEDTTKNANLPENAGIRAIGFPRNLECHILQVKKDFPKAIGGTMWMAMASPEYSVYLPFYGNIADTIEPFRVTDQSYTPASFYWTMRSVNLYCAMNREKYGKNVRAFWKDYERKLLKNQVSEDKKLLEIYTKQGPAAAEKYATNSANILSSDVYEKASQLNKELMTYIADDEGKSKKEPFMPSFMNPEKK